MKHIINLVLGLFITIGFTSCNPYGGYFYYIENKSDTSIYFAFSMVDMDTILYMKLDKGKNYNMIDFQTNNGLRDDGIPYLTEYFDTLFLLKDTINKIYIKKDFSNRANWSYEKIDKGTVSSKIINSGVNIYNSSLNFKRQFCRNPIVL